MSKKFAKMSKDKRAEMGVGTMIIFIAMVLVAAVAASVLISTANTVREQATQTGNDAINSVSSGFDIKYVKGTVADGENTISQMDVFVQLSPGSPALRMTDVILSVTAGSVSGELNYTLGVAAAKASSGSPDTYGAVLVPPAETGEPFAAYGTVQQGDLVKITIKFVGNTDLAIMPGDSVNIKIMPATGSTTMVSFTVPPVLSEGTVDLR